MLAIFIVGHRSSMLRDDIMLFGSNAVIERVWFPHDFAKHSLLCGILSMLFGSNAVIE